MNRLDTAERIKSILTVQEVAERYGVHFDSRGRALCPFHSDSHPSGSVKNGRYHCFVCNLHLDQIDFVRQLFDIDFRQAVVRIDTDFGLRLTGQKPDKRAVEDWRHRKRAEEAAREARKSEYLRRAELHRRIWTGLKSLPQPRTDDEARTYAELVGIMEYQEYRLNELDRRR